MVERDFRIRELYSREPKMSLEAFKIGDESESGLSLGRCSSKLEAIEQLCEHGKIIKDLYIMAHSRCEDNEKAWLHEIHSCIFQLQKIAATYQGSTREQMDKEIRRYICMLDLWRDTWGMEDYTVQDMYLLLPWCICEISGRWV